MLAMKSMVMGLVALLALGCGPITVTNEAGQAVELPEECYFDSDYDYACEQSAYRNQGRSAVVCDGAGIWWRTCPMVSPIDRDYVWCCD